MAVVVQGAYKSYNSGNESVDVLKGIDMNIPYGRIYSLIGASGCGKTTLLKIFSGLLHVDTGEVSVLGSSPRCGPLIGYMPQENSLIEDITVSDTFHIYGRLMNLTKKEIRIKLEAFSTLLDLPPSNSRVGELSGGERRRISLSIALLHDPELIILDEPTVGLDLVLRHRIWEYLFEFTKDLNKTVIITTHYIEEARHSNYVGMMREGILLAEAPPDELLKFLDCPTLGDVFTTLSQKQNENREKGDITEVLRTSKQTMKKQEIIYNFDTKVAKSFHIFLALIFGNYIRFKRNKCTLVFMTLAAFVTLVSVFLAMGAEPKNLKIAIVNQESSCSNLVMSCMDLSCSFLSTINTKKIIQVPFKDYESAKASVYSGDTWGVIHFSKSFSTSFKARYQMKHAILSREILDNSTIKVQLDQSNLQVTDMLKKEIYVSYGRFLKSIHKLCGINIPHVLNLKVHDQIYGKDDFDYAYIVAPGSLLILSYFMGLSITAFTIITEKKEGTWDRSIVSGAKTGVILASHTIWQAFVILILTIESQLIAFYLFKIENRGSLVLTTLTIYSIGLCGILQGSLLSLIFNDLKIIYITVSCTLTPSFLMAGIMWPLEGCWQPLRTVAQYLPITAGNAALSSVMRRSFGVDHFDVYSNNLIIMAWCITTVLINVIICLTVKKK